MKRHRTTPRYNWRSKNERLTSIRPHLFNKFLTAQAWYTNTSHGCSMAGSNVNISPRTTTGKKWCDQLSIPRRQRVCVGAGPLPCCLQGRPPEEHRSVPSIPVCCVPCYARPTATLHATLCYNNKYWKSHKHILSIFITGIIFKMLNVLFKIRQYYNYYYLV